MVNVLTIEKAFNNPRYRTILKLIIDYSNPALPTKINFIYLKYALVKNPKFNDQIITERKCKEFFSTKYTKEFVEDTIKDIEEFKKEYPKANVKMAESLLKINKLKELKDIGFFSDKDKFSLDSSLRDHLGILKKHDYIKQVPAKKGKDYYIPNTKIIDYYQRWFLHFTIDNLIPDNFLILGLIQAIVFRYGLLCKGVEKLKK